ncbi:hypothetical protein QL285_056367 [Trifolium repens]|nr:hypothetical protein QL285_056367 [Trifolium repens]
MHEENPYAWCINKSPPFVIPKLLDVLNHANAILEYKWWRFVYAPCIWKILMHNNSSHKISTSLAITIFVEEFVKLGIKQLTIYLRDLKSFGKANMYP